MSCTPQSIEENASRDRCQDSSEQTSDDASESRIHEEDKQQAQGGIMIPEGRILYVEKWEDPFKPIQAETGVFTPSKRAVPAKPVTLLAGGKALVKVKPVPRPQDNQDTAYQPASSSLG
ncbi:hypothetical protein BDY19DRAFT_1057594 [Irpex rosettiformis]|uniref:Uncharacterized protein n=1 Tax=Irpex rosettiformis TaxID=378272 RepID=A0ACB8U161_9APHY|nr:hypothetical protein BDY19DRAFT_1057594 [Irpex rosettiformis]